MKKPYVWLFLAAVFLALNALLLVGVRDGGRSGALRATAIGLSFH